MAFQRFALWVTLLFFVFFSFAFCSASLLPSPLPSLLSPSFAFSCAFSLLVLLLLFPHSLSRLVFLFSALIPLQPVYLVVFLLLWFAEHIPA